VRLADWPRNPYLNDELREWVALHLRALGVQDVAVYGVASPRHDDERRVLVATEAGLLDGWYAPRGSTARFSLTVRLYPWSTVRGVDLRGETYRLWAYEHQSRWRLRLAHPAFDTLADDAELGRALAEFASACAVMAVPGGEHAAEGEDLPPRPGTARSGPRPPIRVEPELSPPLPRTPAPEHPVAGDDAEVAAQSGQMAFEEQLGLRRPLE
jgi:hypothetical protein